MERESYVNSSHYSISGATEPLIAVVGPTAVGKTTLAVRLAEDFDGEIISADSRQIYRFMDIGTAKPTAEEQRRVPHHLISIVDPDEEFTLAHFQDLACRAIEDVLARGRVPFLVGGTGLYVKAVVEGYVIPRVEPDVAWREAMYRLAEEQGAEPLFERLQQVDPVAASAIEPNNVRRIIRALEVYEHTGRPISDLWQTSAPPYRTLMLGLTMPRPLLYERIDSRVDAMVEAGLVDEVRALVERGYSLDLPAMSGLGYRQIGMYLRGEVDLPEAIRLIKRDTRRFVRHQYGWFRLKDEAVGSGIHWFDVSNDAYDDIHTLVARLLRP